MDGYIARKYNYQTDFGKYLDPIADKVLIISGFVILHIFYSNNVQLWMVAVIICRDLIVRRKERIGKQYKPALQSLDIQHQGEYVGQWMANFINLRVND